ncbi:MAG: tRNA (N6-isopentenyl adenosine(37)-C2)-methylthiotransferase MiaB [candidate division KSB1 bacterium]|nr:tRNA (N6-isopentenyl adenosine(37)-C2)-methylthiotransferase MiaB [candidate division KSB1 bacterium]
MKLIKSQKTFFIQTYGCQMNKYDSELVAAILREKARTIEEANIILVNTCSVRQHAETRALGYLNALNAYKLRRKDVIIGLLGCMAQRMGQQILREKPFVDFVLGPDSYRQLPQILENLDNGGYHPESLAEELETYSDIYPSRVEGVSAWVAIMRGCNNFCAYCIVPYVRGPERSRPAKDILNEVKRLVDEGFVEVTLLGQNVNSYRDGQTDFADLIYQVSQVPGITRVRFATSHPKDLSVKLLETIAESQTICPHIHLPVQSGSDTILRLMNRHYTRDYYLQLLEKARELIREVSVTTDIIVGFPGETEQDFQDTLTLVQQARFDNAFTFKYSPREGTQAAQYEETVTEEEKLSRLETLNKLQKKITLEINKKLVGKKVKVLVEGPSKKSQEQYQGRTDTNKIVVFPKRKEAIGSIIELKIVAAEGHTLFGQPKDEYVEELAS